jgi:hypothetical protein
MVNRIESAEAILSEHSKQMMRRLKRRHRMAFATLVFTGVSFLWYGVWTIISDIPILNNPYIATVIGVIILVGTGMYYENTL